MNLPPFSEENISSDNIILHLDLPEDIAAFQGHFVGHPILPGVVQLDWAMKFAKEYFGIAQPCAQDFQVKFVRPIQPGEITLNLRYSDQKLIFEYRLGTQKCASGSIRLNMKVGTK